MSLCHSVIHGHLLELRVLGLEDTMMNTQSQSQSLSLPSRNLGSIEEGRQSESSVMSFPRGLHRTLKNMVGGWLGGQVREGLELEQQVKVPWARSIMKAQGAVRSSNL